MSNSNYVGNYDTSKALGDNKRFFYALRRTDDGTLYFTRVDQLTSTESITINNPGLPPGDFNEFEYSVDFFDGRLETDHSRPYTNLYFDQWRWDNQNIYYYLNANGEFVARLNGPVYSYS